PRVSLRKFAPVRAPPWTFVLAPPWTFAAPRCEPPTLALPLRLAPPPAFAPPLIAAPPREPPLFLSCCASAGLAATAPANPAAATLNINTLERILFLLKVCRRDSSSSAMVWEHFWMAASCTGHAMAGRGGGTRHPLGNARARRSFRRGARLR